MALAMVPATAMADIGRDGISYNSGTRHPPSDYTPTPSQVPEPSDIALFAAGVLGLAIGRRHSRSRRRDD